MIDLNADLYTLEPMKYYSFSSSIKESERKRKIDYLIESNNYIYSLKTDGNWSRMIWQDGEVALQSRNKSVNTGNFGLFNEKVLFTEKLKNAFNNTTVLIGELYIDGGHDKDVGSILRCLPKKAIDRQLKGKKVKYRIFDCLFYEGINLLQTPIIERIKYLPKAAASINDPLVSYVPYFEAKKDTFYEDLGKIFDNGGEGVVLYNKSSIPCEGTTPAWQTLKIKQTMSIDVDCFIYGVEPAEKCYSGKNLSNWNYWLDTRTGEKFNENKYANYINGDLFIPITKNYFYNWPGAIICAVYDNNKNPIQLCSCSGLTEEFKEELAKNYNKYHMCPIKITGMMLSKIKNKDGSYSYSIRHPKLVTIRDTDIDVSDCTLEKIIREEK